MSARLSRRRRIAAASMLVRYFGAGVTVNAAGSGAAAVELFPYGDDSVDGLVTRKALKLVGVPAAPHKWCRVARSWARVAGARLKDRLASSLPA